MGEGGVEVSYLFMIIDVNKEISRIFENKRFREGVGCRGEREEIESLKSCLCFDLKLRILEKKLPVPAL